MMLCPEIPAHGITNMANGLFRVVSEQYQFQVIGRNSSFHHYTFLHGLLFRVMIISCQYNGKIPYAAGLRKDKHFKKFTHGTESTG